jgi:hypothetical protein
MLIQLTLNYLSIGLLKLVQVFKPLTHLWSPMCDQDPSWFDIGFDVFDHLGDQLKLIIS